MTFWEDILLSLLTPLRNHFTQPSRLGIPTDKQTLDVQNEVGLISLGMLRLPLHLRSWMHAVAYWYLNEDFFECSVAGRNILISWHLGILESWNLGSFGGRRSNPTRFGFLAMSYSRYGHPILLNARTRKVQDHASRSPNKYNVLSSRIRASYVHLFIQEISSSAISFNALYAGLSYHRHKPYLPETVLLMMFCTITIILVGDFLDGRSCITCWCTPDFLDLQMVKSWYGLHASSESLRMKDYSSSPTPSRSPSPHTIKTLQVFVSHVWMDFLLKFGSSWIYYLFRECGMSHRCNEVIIDTKRRLLSRSIIGRMNRKANSMRAGLGTEWAEKDRKMKGGGLKNTLVPEAIPYGELIPWKYRNNSRNYYTTYLASNSSTWHYHLLIVLRFLSPVYFVLSKPIPGIRKVPRC